MARTILNGDPQLSGSFLTWSVTLDPGTFEAPSDLVDTVDCWRMTANDPAGLDVQSELVMQAEIGAPFTMPGDAYTQHVALDELRDGYYHVVLTLDTNGDGEVYELHVRKDSSGFDLKSYHRTM